jgi:hypothetical protein
MNKIPKTIWVLAGLVVAIYMAWSMAYPSGSWRYRMTVSVETPEGIKTGSAVREVHAYTYPQLLSTTMGHVYVRKGEAVVVDLGKRGVLFALIGEDYGWRIVYNSFPFPGSSPAETTGTTVRYYRSLKTGNVTLTPEQYPMFVRFEDLNDPRTVKNIYETGWCLENDSNGTCIKEGFHVKADRFEEMFGMGVRLKEVTIEMTDDPVTRDVQKYLPWLPNYYNQKFDGQRYETIKANNRFANSLAAGAFTTGERK